MEQVSLQELRKLCLENKIMWREHTLFRMKERKIKRDDVKNCILTGEIIEHYPADYPVASCLVFGTSVNHQYLHVVCSVFEDLACIITTYYPSPSKWEADLKNRKVAD